MEAFRTFFNLFDITLGFVGIMIFLEEITDGLLLLLENADGWLKTLTVLIILIRFAQQLVHNRTMNRIKKRTAEAELKKLEFEVDEEINHKKHESD